MMTPYVVTRYYRAPEVILGMGYKENVDIWCQSYTTSFFDFVTDSGTKQGRVFVQGTLTEEEGTVQFSTLLKQFFLRK